MGSTFKIKLTDGNAVQVVDDYAAAEVAVSEWYDFLADDDRYEGVDMPEFNPDDNDIEDMTQLNTLIGEWEEAIASACGHSAVHGHGNYSVSASSEMGLNLRAVEAD